MGIMLTVDISGDWLASATDEQVGQVIKEVCEVTGRFWRGRARSHDEFQDTRLYEWDGEEIRA